MGWTFYNSSGQRLSSAATNISVLDIDGATDIGAAIVDADLFIIDDGAGGTNRKTAASRIATYIAAPSQANQAALEAETDQDTYVPPDLVRHSPGVAKVWGSMSGSSGTLASPSYNIASVGDTGTGRRDVNFTTAMSTNIYACAGSRLDSDGEVAHNVLTTADVEHRTSASAGTNQDATGAVICFGDQA